VFFYWHVNDLRAVRKGPWKLHTVTNVAETAPAKVTKLERPALYNVGVDPSEKYDVAEQHPEVVRELLGLLESNAAGIKPGAKQT